MIDQLEAPKVERRYGNEAVPFDATLRDHFVKNGLAKSHESAHTDVLEHVIQRLRSYKEQYIQNRDPRAIFTDAYEQITGKIRDIITKEEPAPTNGKETFPKRSFNKDNKMWLAALDYRFAQYYFEAITAYDEIKKLEHQGKRENLAEAKSKIRAWAYAFDIIEAGEPVPLFPRMPKASVIQELLLPIFVHTFHDLPIALAEMAVAEAKGAACFSGIMPIQFEDLNEVQQCGNSVRIFQQHIEDFHAINFLLLDEHDGTFTVIDKVQEAVQAYDPFLKYLDEALQHRDEVVTYRIMKLMRGMIWYDATRLLEAPSRNQFEYIRFTEIPHQTSRFIKAFYWPSSPLVRILWLSSRFVAGLTRTWPHITPSSSIEQPPSSSSPPGQPSKYQNGAI